jgi:HK97 family phage portal protein
MATLARPVQWLIDFFTGGANEGDRRVTPDSALSYAPIWYAVNKICNNIGQLPLNFYRRTDDGKERANDDDRHMLLHLKPNAFQTACIFKSQVMSHALLWGNGRAYINRSGRRIAELIPILPDRTITVLIEGEKYHLTKPDAHDRLNLFETLSNETGMRDVIILRDSEVMHIPGFGYDGIEGLSLLQIAARSWNAGISGDKRYNTQASKGFAAKFMIEAPSGMFRNEQDAKQFLHMFNEYHAGPENSDKVGLLREGMKLQTMAMSNQDAQFLENRRYQRQEAALWFMLETILGDGSSETYRSFEHKNMAYLTNCLMTWIVKWEQELNCKLLSSREIRNDSHFFKFNTGAFLRADFATTMQSLRSGVEALILSPNEARDILDFNRREGGDDFINPNTMSPEQATVEVEEPEEEEPEEEEDDQDAPDIAGPSNQYEGINFTPPEGVRSEAKKGLEWRRQYNRGGTAVGVARARDLSSGKNISPDTAKRMKSYFARHEVDKKGKGFSPGEDGYPSAGRIAWALWGGDAGQAWANKLVRQMESSQANAQENGPSRSAERIAIRSHLEHLVGVEQKRILEFAKNPKKFTDKSEAFYSKFSTTLAAAIAKFSTDDGKAQGWCDQSRQILLQVSECQPDQLISKIEEEFATWGKRIDTLTDKVLEDA